MYQANLFASKTGEPLIKSRGGGVTNSHIFFNKVISLPNLYTAWKKFCRGKMSATKVEAFFLELEDALFSLHDELNNGTYQHGPYEHFYVHDPKRRYISEPTVRDRVLHQAIVQVIEPIFERQFILDSYSSRMGKGIHAAVVRLEQFLQRSTRNYRHEVWALKCDIRRFFDSISHDILLKVLQKNIQEQKLYALIKMIVKSYSVDEAGSHGLPLGNSTSQLFANLYLNSFDHFVKEQLRMRFYLRFCDDFIIVHADRDVLEQRVRQIENFLSIERGLELHPQKVEMRKLSQGIDFVGQVLRKHYRVTRAVTARRAFRNIHLACEKYQSGRLSDERLRQIIQSYLGIFSHGSNYRRSKQLRDEVRRKLVL